MIRLLHRRADEAPTGLTVLRAPAGDELAQRWRLWREEKPMRAAKDNGAGLNSALVFARLSELVPEDAIMCVDVGNSTYSFGRYFECRRQSVICPATSARSASASLPRWGPGPPPAARWCRSAGTEGSASTWRR